MLGDLKLGALFVNVASHLPYDALPKSQVWDLPLQSLSIKTTLYRALQVASCKWGLLWTVTRAVITAVKGLAGFLPSVMYLKCANLIINPAEPY